MASNRSQHDEGWGESEDEEEEEEEPRISTMVIKLIDGSVTGNLIRKEDKMTQLLIKSKFEEEMEGFARFNYREHKIIVRIKDDRKVPELSKITQLGDKELGYWPVECYCPIHTQPIKKIEGGQMIIKFKGEAVTKNLVGSKHLTHALIKESVFGIHYTGSIRYNEDEHEIRIYIENKDYIQNLVQTTTLGNRSLGYWEIECRVPFQRGFSDGVMKNIEKDEPTEWIKNELIERGYNISNVWRIYDRKRKPTHCVRIRFTDKLIPRNVQYYWSTKKIHKYIPRVKICHKCARSGHKAENCSTGSLNCPRCNGNHSRTECEGEIPADRKCRNCGENHSAN